MARSKIACLVLVLGMLVASVAYATSGTHVFGPYTGPTFSTEGSWVTHNLPANAGQLQKNFNVITNVSYAWAATGHVCQAFPPTWACTYPQVGLPAGFQAKICMDPAVTGGEGWGCADVTGVPNGWTGAFNNHVYAMAPPKVSFKFFVPAGASTDQIRGVGNGWANGVTIHRDY